MTLEPLLTVPSFPPPSRTTQRSDAERVRLAVDAHHDAVWRFLRRLGVPPADVEDAAQKVFVVFARRVSAVEPRAEHSFLFASALRVASDLRRQRASSREILADGDDTPDHEDPAPSVEEEIDGRRLRRWLDDVLDTLSDEHRAVLVLVDLEEQTMAQASDVLGIPPGTVASRLRRSRELFEAAASALKARLENEV